MLWNKGCITTRNKSIFYSKWFERSINNILSVLDEHGLVLSYESFISRHNFPIPFKEYNSVIKAIPSGLPNLMKSHLSFCKGIRPEGSPVLLLNGINIQDKKCNNKHIRKCFQDKKRFSPRGKFYWRSQDIDWEKAWLLPHKYCIHNKVKNNNFKIIHKIYPVNSFILKCMDVDSFCVFCGHADETLNYLLF